MVAVAGVVEAYPDLARRIMDRPARLGRTRLIAVDGPSGAGKTHFAERLADTLQALVPDRDRPPIVHTDDLLAGWADQFTFWPRLEEQVLAPIRAGHPGHYRCYDWDRGCFTSNWTTVPAAPVVILEGVSVARSAVRAELTLSVFVTAPDQLRLDRALARDGVAIRPYLEEWRRGELIHFAADATVEHVDLMIDGASDLPHDPGVHYVRLSPRRAESP
ncbi:hypothetical protein GCM10027290_41890 [Micromonospora sonneratiae]|uniref:Uridine kinase n=1 Tax=Micromonospora sonneratiae TaxID=1184706 RepID=A0ABW3YE49_9ACTN